MADKKKDERTRNWTILVYPSSAPKDWREILDNIHVPWIEGPLHDKDLNPDGTTKKPHWHIILVFDEKKAFHQIEKIADKLNSPIPKKVESLRGMVRYLIHKDNPEKHQYPKSQIKNHGVDDLEKYFQTASSQRQTLKEISDYIRENHIIHLTDLVGYAMDKDDWFDVITNRNTMFLTALIKSEWQKQFQIQERKFRNQEIDDNAIRAKNMRDKGIKVSQIADTLGVSRRMVYKYLKE